MSYILKTDLARRENYGDRRSTSQIKYIVIHYTANDGDTDEANGKYFRNNVVKASAHYFVDDDSVTQSVPDDYVAWSVGGRKLNDTDKTGGGKLFGIANNTNSISIELCDTKRDGKVMATETTMANAAELCKKLMAKYNVPIDRVIRHFDVTGKHCPAYMMDATSWNNFKKRLTSTTAPVKPSTPTQNLDGFRVSVTIRDLNIRKGPGTNYTKVGVIAPGVYTITDTVAGKGSSAGWGKLKSGVGWISLDFVKKL